MDVRIFMDDTTPNRAQMNSLWQQLVNRKNLFIEIPDETSTVTTHLCHHDENPPLPCVVKSNIILGDIEKEELF